jgi:hypothetical protein
MSVDVAEPHPFLSPVQLDAAPEHSIKKVQTHLPRAQANFCFIQRTESEKRGKRASGKKVFRQVNLFLFKHLLQIHSASKAKWKRVYYMYIILDSSFENATLQKHFISEMRVLYQAAGKHHQLKTYELCFNFTKMYTFYITN